MNRIETKIIIMVTNRLAAAKDSDAKTEMIEELSENLYQRYLELVAGGMSEDDALQQAMGSLGDVDELLSFLKESESADAIFHNAAPDAAANTADRTEENSAPDIVPAESSSDENSQDKNSQDKYSQDEYSQDDDTIHVETYEGEPVFEDNSFSFNFDDFGNEITGIVNAAFSKAKVAMGCAKDAAMDAAKEVQEQFKEKYPDGVFTQFSSQSKEHCHCVPSDNIHSIEIHLSRGDIHMCCIDDSDAAIDLDGDTEEIEVMLKDDGVLSISQASSTASAAFFFMRGMHRCDIDVRLPKKLWNRINISTTSGDISIENCLECEDLNISTSSGDMNLDDVLSNNMICHLSSGDINGKVRGNLHVESKSGDIEIEGNMERCELFSASGDIEFSGKCQDINCSSTSGDVELKLAVLPERTKGTSVSGDCKINVPSDKGFRISYKTVSGDFLTNLPLTGMMREKRGEAVFGDNVCGDIQLSSVSGDIHICAKDN